MKLLITTDGAQRVKTYVGEFASSQCNENLPVCLVSPVTKEEAEESIEKTFEDVHIYT